MKYESMSTKSFLEIVVPTFNRSHILVSTLKELIAAVSTQNELIALRIVDNCSTDDTPFVIEPYVKKGLVTYERNQCNIGLIKNIAKCISTSRAQWVWVFGDDDHILIHSLPFILNSLGELGGDTVFARALCAKVSNNGSIVNVEKQLNGSESRIVRHDPGMYIACHGSIHSLAFISQLIFNPMHWNQEYHDSIYCETDLYTFVLTVLNECANKSAADLNIHIVAATDRGDRSYYTSNMCISRLTEYTSYERAVHAALGRNKARKVLSVGRKNLLRFRIASCFKLVAYGDAYLMRGKDPISYMLTYHSPYLTDVLVIRTLALAANFPLAKAVFKLIYDYLYRKKN